MNSCEISKNTFSYRTPPVAACALVLQPNKPLKANQISCEISNNTFFTEHLRMTASVSGKLHIDNLTIEIDSTIGIISEKRHVRKICEIVCWLSFIIYAKPCAK